MISSDSSNSNPPLFLVGFMACGKSTIGQVLSKKLHRPFIDLDEWIETKIGCTIAELIKREGEERFRQIETETLQRSAQSELSVIAPGGGAITRAENRELMSQLGITVWLDAPFDLCWQRIKQDRVVRPLAPNEEAARLRYEQRTPLYRQSTIHIVITEAQSPDDISETIIERLRFKAT